MSATVSSTRVEGLESVSSMTALSALHFPTKSTSGTPLRRRTQQGVTFDRNVKVVEICHVSDRDEDQIRQLWVTEQEYHQTHDACRRLARIMEEHASTKKKKGSHSKLNHADQMKELAISFFTRGLEACTAEGAAKRRFRRLSARQAILHEQQFQTDEGSFDPEFIRELYQRISGPSQKEAHEIALEDEKVAMKYYSKTTEKHRTTKCRTSSVPRQPSRISSLNSLSERIIR